MATGLEKVHFHSNPKKGNAKECSNYRTGALIFRFRYSLITSSNFLVVFSVQVLNFLIKFIPRYPIFLDATISRIVSLISFLYLLLVLLHILIFFFLNHLLTCGGEIS